MSLQEQMQREIQEAMKARESLRLAVLRMMKTALKNKEIEKREPLEESEEMAVVRTLVKQRRDSIEQFRKGGREELAQKEEAELKLVEAYLPPAVDESKIDQAVVAAVLCVPRDEVVGSLACVEKGLLGFHGVATDIRHVIRVALVTGLRRGESVDLFLNHVETLENTSLLFLDELCEALQFALVHQRNPFSYLTM